MLPQSKCEPAVPDLGYPHFDVMEAGERLRNRLWQRWHHGDAPINLSEASVVYAMLMRPLQASLRHSLGNAVYRRMRDFVSARTPSRR